MIRRIAKLGEAGKWHRVLWYSENPISYRTACHLTLEPFASTLRSVEIAVKDGEPTCKHCIRTDLPSKKAKE